MVQNIGNKPLDSGSILIFRYLVSLLSCFEESDPNVDALRLASREFSYYAHRVETEQDRCARNFVEPVISRLTESQRRVMFTEILDQEVASTWSDELKLLRSCNRAQSLLFYTALRLEVRL